MIYLSNRPSHIYSSSQVSQINDPCNWLITCLENQKNINDTLYLWAILAVIIASTAFRLISAGTQVCAAPLAIHIVRLLEEIRYSDIRACIQKLEILSISGDSHLWDFFSTDSCSSLFFSFQSCCCLSSFISCVCFIHYDPSLNSFSSIHICFESFSMFSMVGVSLLFPYLLQ